MLSLNLSLLILFLTVGCSQFQTHRDYLSEMEHDDSSYFNPRSDFPIVAGDTGDESSLEETLRDRTPASAVESQLGREQSALRNELRDLESTQNESLGAAYKEYKQKLNTSERIYLLKLSDGDRRDYLESKGLLAPERPVTGAVFERERALNRSEIILGMTKKEVLGNFGKPLRVEVAGNPSNENERWVYTTYGAAKYIYFESGEVQGWE